MNYRLIMLIKFYLLQITGAMLLDVTIYQLKLEFNFR
jgi:hypothetical protein